MPVLAHSRRWESAPASASLRHRGRGKPLPVGFVDLPGYGDTETVPQCTGNLVHHRLVPAADEDRGDRGDLRVEPGVNPSLNASAIRVGRRHILLARKQQGDIHRHAGEDRFFDGLNACGRAWNLDEQVGTMRLRVQPLGGLDSGAGIISEQRRHFQGNPAINAARRFMDRPEECRSLRQVFERQFEE